MFAVVCAGALAQNASAPTQKPIKGSTETLVVLGSATPVPLTESPRPVDVLPVEPLKLAA